jgi:sulfatase maturation enzyme AslB (radical SAM superfamily)
MENYTNNKKLANFVICDQDIILNTTHINLLTTNQCNNSCWYCCSDCHIKQESYDYFPDSYFDNLLEFIDIQGNPNLDLHFIGGEPTLHPKLKEWCVILEDRYGQWVDMHMTTNAMMPLGYWNNFPMRAPNGSVTCSFHSDFVKDPDEWFDKMRILRDNNSLGVVFLMAQKNNLELLKRLYDKYRPELPVKISPIFQVIDTPEYREFIRNTDVVEQNEHRETLSTNYDTNVQVVFDDGSTDNDNFDSYNNFRGMMCNSGFVVLPNGDVTYCYMDDKPIINLLRDRPKKLDKWHICKFKFCNCEFEFQKCSIQHYLRNIKCK